MKKITFTAFACRCITRLEKECRYSTAHLYKNALRSYSDYLSKSIVLFSDISRDSLKGYQRRLVDEGCQLNTVSTYMRMLRSIYNQGVDMNYAPYVNRLFHDVYTGIDSGHKKALSRKELQVLFYKDPGTEELRKVQCGARLIYQLCGIPFVDLTHISCSNINGNVLEYRRMKTGVKVSVKLLKPTIDIIRHYAGAVCSSTKKKGQYLFNLLKSEYSFRSKEGYTEYQNALRHFNHGLCILSRTLGLKENISSYTLRHSWATIAKYIGVPIEMISELLGHKSIKTTQIYLASFKASDLAKVNKKVYKYVEI